MAESGRQRAEGGRQRAEGGRQRAEGGRRKAESGRQRAEKADQNLYFKTSMKKKKIAPDQKKAVRRTPPTTADFPCEVESPDGLSFFTIIMTPVSPEMKHPNVREMANAIKPSRIGR
jgi:hypothetical protein